MLVIQSQPVIAKDLKFCIEWGQTTGQLYLTGAWRIS